MTENATDSAGSANGQTSPNPKGDNEVYMCVVRTVEENGQQQTVTTPVAYDITGDNEGARPLVEGEAPPSLDEFYELVSDDMDDLAGMLVDRARESGMSRGEIFLVLLSDMQSQPQELVHNMLAAMLTEAATDTNDPVVAVTPDQQ